MRVLKICSVLVLSMLLSHGVAQPIVNLSGPLPPPPACPPHCPQPGQILVLSVVRVISCETNRPMATAQAILISRALQDRGRVLARGVTDIDGRFAQWIFVFANSAQQALPNIEFRITKPGFELKRLSATITTSPFSAETVLANACLGSGAGTVYVPGELMLLADRSVLGQLATLLPSFALQEISRDDFGSFVVFRLRITDSEDAPAKFERLQQFIDQNIIFKEKIRNELNFIGELQVASSLPNDPAFALQWNLLNNAQRYPSAQGPDQQGFAGVDIAITRAWDMGLTDSSTVHIAVIDSGVRATHPDLHNNLRLDLGWNFVQNDALLEDQIGHGTFVTSLIGAIGNNSLGITGTNWKASIIPLKVTDPISVLQQLGQLILKTFGLAEDKFVSAVKRAIDLKKAGVNVRIINFSAGFRTPPALAEEVIRQAGEAGILFITAAGNDGKNVDETPLYPCNSPLPNVICVGASTSTDQLASFSNYSLNHVDLVAPGENIIGLVPKDLPITKETLLGTPTARRLLQYGDVAVASGTSFSVPQVTGMAALLFAVLPDKRATDIKDLIVKSVQRKPAFVGKILSAGRLKWPDKLR